MADSEVRVRIKAEDQTKGAVSSAQGNLEGLKGTAMKLGGVLAGAFAVGKIVSFGKETLQAFADSEAAVGRIDARLRTMGAAGTEARDSIMQAGQAAIKMGFDDEAAAESLTKFFQATGNLTEAQKLNAIAMDIARGKGIELGDAQKAVQLILAGNTRELKAMGIEVEEGATGMENLTKVSQIYAGQAETFSKSTSGQMEVLKVTVDNLKESLGEGVAQGLQPFFDVMMKIAQDPAFLESIKATAGFIGGTFLAVIKAIRVAIDFVSVAIFGWMNAWEALKRVWTESIQPVFKAMGDFIQGVIDKVNTLISVVSSLASKASGAFSAIAGAVGFGGKRADGGPVFRGTPYLVGERGPELFVPGTAGFVAPSGSFGGSTIAININGGMYLDEYGADMVGTKIVERLRSQFRF